MAISTTDAVSPCAVTADSTAASAPRITSPRTMIVNSP